MPKIVKTIKSNVAVASKDNITKNIIESIAAAIGDEAHTMPGEGVQPMYVLMDKVGYPGWAITVIWTGSVSYPTVSIVRVDDNSTPQINDPHKIEESGTSFIASTFPSFSAITCVIMRDETNDTVLINIHTGEVETRTDSYTSSGNNSIFFARDINNDVLCGIGKSCITSIRMAGAHNSAPSSSASPQNTLIPDCLHLTKMVNYLSPGYPEMKSAYVSVVRPAAQAGVAQSYYANGDLWGNAGNRQQTTGAYFPYDPFVKY